MENVIIVLIIVALAAVGIYSTVKHFKGESGCCGGGGYTPKKKHLKNVILKKTFSVEGMHCKNCKGRVEEVINDMDGLSGQVDLAKGELTVAYSREVSDDIIISRLKRAGYPASVKHE